MADLHAAVENNGVPCTALSRATALKYFLLSFTHLEK